MRNDERAGQDSARRRRRRWRFGEAVFDEASWSLLVAGRPRPLEAKPVALLHELLLRAGEAVSKDELLDAVWPGLTVVDSSLAVAVSKLRRALGDDDGARIETVPRIGYRLTGPVAVESLDAPLAPRFAFRAGEGVPGRPQWRLSAALGTSGANDVWRARHDKTGETRVFKFADAPDRLRALKREAMLARLLAATLGADGPFVPLLEWNFEAAPYFTESRDGGRNLIEWAQAAGGLGAIAADRRVALARALAQALARVHDAGVLHRDLKPANILVEERSSDAEHGALRVRLVDFGSGHLLDFDLLSAYALTPDYAADDAPGGTTGTPLYRAPELAGNPVPTAKSDIYSLGIIVYQLVAGDFTRNLAPGWERDVADPLLCEDIAAAAAGDPGQRIGSAGELAARLGRLEARRAQALARDLDDRRLADLARREDRRAARRPWVRAAAAAVVAGLIGTSTAAVLAVRQRDEAGRQQAIAQASYDFLAEDLLSQADPAIGSALDQTIGQALQRASGDIGRRFARQPHIAAGLHHSLAIALSERADTRAADPEFRMADALFARAGDDDARAVIAFQRTVYQAKTPDEASAGAARKAFDAARARWGEPDRLSGRAGLWAHAAAGHIALAEDRAEDALGHFERSAAVAGLMPDLLTARERIAVRQRVIGALLRLDRAPQAEADARALARVAALTLGAEHPDTLLIRLNIAQALLAQEKNDAIIREATDLLPSMERRFGTDHPRTLQLLGSRMDGLKNLGRYAEAMQDGDRVWRSAARRFGELSFYAVGARLDTARVKCRATDVAGGVADARQAHAWSLKGFGDKAALTHGVAHGLADCLIASGQHAAASRYLTGIDRKAVGELVGNANWGLHVELLLAQIAVAQGRTEQARQHFTAARPAFADLETDAYEAERIRRIGAALGRRPTA